MTIDLVRQLVISPAGEDLSFEIDKQRREALLEGLDDIDRTLNHVSAITAWQAADRLARPWVWQPVTPHQANE
jgi:3-isopropylmalate/(R)-2-methylmalate dehydratase small subunit